MNPHVVLWRSFPLSKCQKRACQAQSSFIDFTRSVNSAVTFDLHCYNNVVTWCTLCCRTDYFYHGRLDWDPNTKAGRYVREMCKPIHVSGLLRRDNGNHLMVFCHILWCVLTTKEWSEYEWIEFDRRSTHYLHPELRTQFPNIICHNNWSQDRISCRFFNSPLPFAEIHEEGRWWD